MFHLTNIPDDDADDDVTTFLTSFLTPWDIRLITPSLILYLRVEFVSGIWTNLTWLW